MESNTGQKSPSDHGRAGTSSVTQRKRKRSNSDENASKKRASASDERAQKYDITQIGELEGANINSSKRRCQADLSNATPDKEQLCKNRDLFALVSNKGAEQDQLSKLEELLAGGADVNAKDLKYDKNTPLHMAAEEGKVEFIRILLAKGADLNARNYDGKLPIDLALQSNAKNLEEIIKILQLHMKTTSGQKADLQPQHTDVEFPYRKRPGTSAISGQLYEVKLAALLLCTVLDCADIEVFYLAVNLDGVGACDDIVCKYRRKGDILASDALTCLVSRHQPSFIKP